ncbi:Na+/H+ antiporter NhaA [Arachidicoccus ginsenosidimutans]|uniref:Na+/H+ antiporter NhaA n=1 Tax=Arachidicoccus sp. BS20 TaxID=1850526 RepID=UPI0007F15C58|nr:Na+/H+ antiporter NhaA [Arachidicoccus sp. BS20]ANI89547.1 Na+/H+ antiporter NhaA [Arachidicoccus sp. BS20]
MRKKIQYTLYSFIHDSRSVGIVLLCCTALSLIISNLSFGKGYHDFWEMEIPFFQAVHLPHSMLHFINDALMAVFFFLAGMEIKREMLVGELSSLKQAILPVIAAMSGVALPAIIFLLFNKGTDFQNGWAIPTATDIAFSLGIVALLGKKVPDSLRVFLTALAIIDDLIAILVIALFYGSQIEWLYFLGAIAAMVSLFFLNKMIKQKFQWLRLLFGVALWFCMYHSGIHATVAGVVFAFLLPRELLHVYEDKLHTFVNFVVIPIFVLANTSILLPSNFLGAFESTLSWGIIVGLFIGKPLGIVGVSLGLIKSKLAEMPHGANLRQFWGVGILAGIGFTMSIFVSSLAFNNADVQSTAKIAVIAGSFLSMIVGFIWLKFSCNKQ